MYFKMMCLLFLLTAQVNAASLNQLFQDPIDPFLNEFNIGSKQPVMINDRILFEGRAPNGSALWALDINTMEKTELLQGYGSSRFEFIRMGDQVFFKFNTDNISGEKIWRSDGTVEGTQLFYSDKRLDHLFSLKKSGSVFYTKTEDDELLVSDGAQVFIHPIDPMYGEGVCAFSIDNIVIYNTLAGSTQYRWSVGNESIELNLNFTDVSSFYSPEVIKYNNSCYVVAPVEGSETDTGIRNIDENGQVSMVTTTDESGTGLSQIYQIISHQDRLYATARNYGNIYVYRLTENLSSIDGFIEISDFPRMFSSGPYLGLMAFPPTSPPIIVINFVTTDLLSTVVSLSDFGGGSDLTSPYLFYPTQNQWLMAESFQLGNISETKSLIFSPYNDDELIFELPEFDDQKIITEESSDRVFVLSSSKESRSTLYEIVPTPKINSLIDGSWVEPDIKSQGLMLRTGQRHDGSEYLVATIYTYDDGEPLWLAGNQDIETNMDSIEVDLFSFQGLDFFEPEFDAEATPFGSLKLQLNSCDRMTMELQTPLGTKIHTLVRVDDVKATQHCVDQ